MDSCAGCSYLPRLNMVINTRPIAKIPVVTGNPADFVGDGRIMAGAGAESTAFVAVAGCPSTGWLIKIVLPGTTLPELSISFTNNTIT
jgi:hypothetical protein